MRIFDSGLVDRLVRKSRQLGIKIELQSAATRIERKDGGFVVCASTVRGQCEFEAGLVVHGAGRVADLDDLDLAAAGVQADNQGVKVNEFLQSVSNPAFMRQVTRRILEWQNSRRWRLTMAGLLQPIY